MRTDRWECAKSLARDACGKELRAAADSRVCLNVIEAVLRLVTVTDPGGGSFHTPGRNCRDNYTPDMSAVIVTLRGSPKLSGATRRTGFPPLAQGLGSPLLSLPVAE